MFNLLPEFIVAYITYKLIYTYISIISLIWINLIKFQFMYSIDIHIIHIYIIGVTQFLKYYSIDTLSLFALAKTLIWWSLLKISAVLHQYIEMFHH